MCNLMEPEDGEIDAVGLAFRGLFFPILGFCREHESSDSSSRRAVFIDGF